MQFNSIIKAFALTTLVAAEHSICGVDHSGRKQTCTIQFKSDAESLGKFAEVGNYLRGLRCSWIAAEDLSVNYSTGTATTHLPIGFVDTVFASLPQYTSYVASKNCN